MTSSVPNLHNTKILDISGTRGDMTIRKMPFFFTFKGLSNKPFFNSSIFHFIGTLIIVIFSIYIHVYFQCNIRYVILSDAHNKDAVIIIIV